MTRQNRNPPKLIYFAHRRPGVGDEAFVARWRQHGRLGMGLPRWSNILRYEQCDRVQAGGDGQGAACDGVAIVVFRDEAARLAHAADPDARITRADEADTFDRPVRDTAVLTVPTLVHPHSTSGTKLFVAVSRDSGIGATAFAATWVDRLGPEIGRVAARSAPKAGFTRNRARADGPNGIGVDLIDEFSCASDDEAVALIRSLKEIYVMAGRYAWIVTREHVLHPH